MKLANMKLPKREAEKTAGVEVAKNLSSPREEYPWGLRLTFEIDQIKKLGLDCSVDDLVKISAIGKVTSVRKEEMAGDDKDRHTVEIQITDIAVKSSDDYEGAFKEALGKE